MTPNKIIDYAKEATTSKSFKITIAILGGAFLLFSIINSYHHIKLNRILIKQEKEKLKSRSET